METNTEYSLKSIKGPIRFWHLDVYGSDGKSGVVSLSDRLLPSRTQAEHIEHKILAIKSKDEGYIESAPFYHTFFRFLYYNREHPEFRNGIEEIVNLLRDSFKKYLITS